MLLLIFVAKLSAISALTYDLTKTSQQVDPCAPFRDDENPSEKIITLLDTTASVKYQGFQPFIPIKCYMSFCMTDLTKSLVVDYTIKSFGDALEVNMYDDDWVWTKGGYDITDKIGTWNATWKTTGLNYKFYKSCVNLKIGNKEPNQPQYTKLANIVITIRAADAKESDSGIDSAAWDNLAGGMLAAGTSMVTIIIIIVCVVLCCPIIICIICCCVGGACAAQGCYGGGKNSNVVVVAQQNQQQPQQYPSQGYQQAGYNQQPGYPPQGYHQQQQYGQPPPGYNQQQKY